MSKDAKQTLLTVSDAARQLGVGSDLIRYLNRVGKLPAIKTEKGMRLFRPEDIEDLRKEREINPPRRFGRG